MPRIAADPASVTAAFADAIAAGLIPPPADRGGPVAGVVVQPEPDGAVVVLGGVHPMRVGARSATRLKAILSGAVDARPGEIMVLHRLGLWGGVADASPESVFFSRRAASTRRHSGGDEAAAALRAAQVRVVGESALAVALRALLEDGCSGPRPTEGGVASADVQRSAESEVEPDPGSGAGAEWRSAPLVLIVDTDLADPFATAAAVDQAAIVVRTTAAGVSIGPWVEAGERPCSDCVAAATVDCSEVTETSTARTRTSAALAALELANTTAGVGRTVRPGVAVDHDLDAGASRMRLITPRPECWRCSGPALDKRERQRSDTEALADLAASLLVAPPSRRWRPPAEHEVHLTAAALRPQHDGTHAAPLVASSPLLRALLTTREQDGVVTRAQPSAGNLGAATLIERGNGHAVAVDLDRLSPKYGRGARALGLADAGALLGAVAVAAHRCGAPIVVPDDALHLQPNRVVGPTIRLVRGADECGFTAEPAAVATPERERSIRDPRWTESDALIIRRAEVGALALIPVPAEIRLELIRPDGTLLAAWPSRAPSTHSGGFAVATPAASAARTNVRDCLAQADVGEEAALLIATVDLRRTTSLDRCRHAAAALLGAVAALAAEDGVRGCLVHGLVPDAVADALGGGLLSSFPLFGWLCGRDSGMPE